MKSLHWVITTLILIFAASCSQDTVDGLATDTQVQYPTRNYVFAYKTSNADTPNTRAIMAAGKKWDQESTINIAFLNGNQQAQEKVKNVAKQWEKLINLKFNYDISIEEADVKIGFSFNGDHVSWSYLGLDSWSEYSNSKPTMNLTLFDQNDNTEINSIDFEAIILRQFGHMLGLVHEHQGPKSNVQLNEQKVYSYFRQFGWNDKQIQEDVLKKYNIKNSNAKGLDFDENSIMMLYIPAHLTTNGVGSNKFNTQLSENDKKVIAEWYPRTEPDEYKPGAEGSVYMTLYANITGSHGLAPWNYDNENWSTSGQIEKTYRTIGVGEYVWTAENLKLKYQNKWGTLLYFINQTQEKVNTITKTNNVYTVKQFEDVFGTWVGHYTEAINYKTPGYYNFYTSKDKSQKEEFFLPVAEDMLQMIGQMPRPTGNVYKDFTTFVYADPAAIEKLSGGTITGAQRNFSPYIKEGSNTSKLNMTPLGLKESYDAGSHYSYGYGFALQLKDGVSLFRCTDAERLEVNRYLYHFTQARYCRKMTPQELGYDLYIDAANDKVLVLSPNTNKAGLERLPNGLERGIALRYKNSKQNIICESWSTIQKEAKEIGKQVTMHSNHTMQ